MKKKWCVVPQCTSTSTKTPEKLFISIPKDAKIRKKWLQLARRNPDDIVVSSNVFMCEDHFDMEKDIINYTQFKMGFSQRLLIAQAAIPSKFHCQQDRRKRLCEASTSRPAYAKRQKIELIQECFKETQSTPDYASKQDNYIEVQEVITSQIMEPQLTHYDKETATEPVVTAEKSVQVKTKKHYRSKAVQTISMTSDICTSPFKISTASKYTSPFKITPCHLKPSALGATGVNKQITFLDDERSNSDVSYVLPTSSSAVSDSDIGTTDTNINMQKLQSLKNTLYLIGNKPMMYVGISKDCYFLIQLIVEQCNIPVEHVLMCLKKIRLNSSFSELEDNFGMSLSYGSKLFLKNIPLIASVLSPFIVKIDKNLIKKNLPISFRQNYYNVSCIIDCLEIDIQKPSKALNQALTWSDYKKANTVKYLISCTPNGLINYISPGFGGRATDITIMQNCDFLDKLEPGTCILADRGFKHVEQLLLSKGVKLVRPPTVTTGSKLSKTEVRQTKVIASLRIHIERVIRRVREFHMLKQHSVINSNILRILNDVIIIVCALINIQDSLIK